MDNETEVDAHETEANWFSRLRQRPSMLEVIGSYHRRADQASASRACTHTPRLKLSDRRLR
eukprot:scaffold372610_cov18-Prasinocladus_malaysianus.AAC.1